MQRALLFLPVLVALLSSCADKNRGEDVPEYVHVSLRTDLPDGATADIYTKDGPGVQTVTFEAGKAELSLPAETRRIYAVSPSAGIPSGNASAVTVRIAAEQQQASSGEENLLSRALQAVSAVEGGQASLHFSLLCGTVRVKVSGCSTGAVHSAGLISANHGLCGQATVNLIRSELYKGGTGRKVSVLLDKNAAHSAELWIRTAADNLGKVKLCILTTDQQHEFTLSKDLDCSGAATVTVETDLESGRVFIDGVEDTAAVSGLSNHDFSALDLADEYEDCDRIPDFSRVGYKYGDEAIPSPAVAATIDVASISAALSARSASDTTDYIQKVIDQVGAAGGGAILFKNGTYNVSRILFLDRSGIVLRGESENGTVIKSRRHVQAPVINIGATVKADSAPDNASTVISGRVVNVSTMKAAGTGGNSTFGSVIITTFTPRVGDRTYGFLSPVVDDHTPLGRLYLRVRDASRFHPGERVAVFRPGTVQWISDIGMDKIADNGRSAQGSGTIQWDPYYYSFYWTRVVTAVRGDQVWLDAPVVMAIDRRYGGGMLVKYQMDRVSGCGVERLTVDCDYDASQVYNGQPVDERHAWIAVSVTAAEHCWVRNLTSRHMGFALCKLNKGSRCISVLDCTSLEPVSAVQGARRYAFCAASESELGLFKNCRCDNDRHCFVNNDASLGPHVFTQCTGTNAKATAGPHNNFATGTLYDCVKSDYGFEAQDGGCQGTGHGWRGANTVFWNCDCGNHTMVVQNLWASAKNYAVGCVCKKMAWSLYYDHDYYGNPTTDYYVSLYGYGSYGENRPDGVWYPERAYRSEGGSHVSLPHDPGLDWWPILTLEQYTQPLSLYECQLQERHAKGIYLNLL